MNKEKLREQIESSLTEINEKLAELSGLIHGEGYTLEFEDARFDRVEAVTLQGEIESFNGFFHPPAIHIRKSSRSEPALSSELPDSFDD